MALQIRGTTQILDATVSLEKIADVASGSILGRISSESGKPEALTAAQALTNLGLTDSDSVEFGDISGTDIDMQGQTLDLTGLSSGSGITIDNDAISGDKIHGGDISGDLTLSGSTITVSNALVHSGSGAAVLSSSNVDINGGNIDGTIIGSNSSASGTFTDLVAVGTGSSSLNNVVIGNNTAASGAFTSLDSTSLTVGDSNELSVSNAGVLSTSGTISSTSASGTNTFAGNLSIGGNLTVEGTTTTVDTENLIVKDPLIKMGEGNNADLKDLGFFGEYVNGSSETKYMGLFRDATDGEFKLFTDFGTEPSGNVIGDISSSIATLNADIKGDVTGDLTGNADTATTLATARSFSVSGDVSTASSVSFNGGSDVELAVTLGDGVVDFAHIHDDVIVTSSEGLSNFDSDVMVPTAAAIIDYVGNQTSTGGMTLTGSNVGDIQMVNSSGTFVAVALKSEFITVNSASNADLTNQTADLSASADEVDSQFEYLVELYINGQKLRYDVYSGSSFSYGDFSIISDGSDNKRIQFNGDSSDPIIANGDLLELKYYVVSSS
tara:strand:- start:1448 stop:3106 length:1659 start_codon:yes stop_codon:yes gene_type:complete